MVKYATIEYYKMLADALNKDADFTKLNANTTKMDVFADRPGPDGQPKAFLLKVEKGKVTAMEAKASDSVDISFTGDYALMVSIAKGEVKGDKAKLKYNMMKAMKNQKRH